MKIKKVDCAMNKDTVLKDCWIWDGHVTDFVEKKVE